VTWLLIGLIIVGAGAALEWAAHVLKRTQRALATRRVQKMLEDDSVQLRQLRPRSPEGVSGAAEHFDDEYPHAG